ncbi:hypothetical protein [Rhodospirillum rubrum]|uniref:Uncharacterized protein n=1 Tax=Rhodospirillum rubrum (strain ATCC 11170 / ATH 1.1.1 / DSM 467 / LMG 4362 / NCIMB 8255 / S1) TaxID=269796 RepID=Q2RTQ9_RHORT|nr:hypothetical protein [Rhodospirillum rubrum]ABC22486.1 hypothetical protein Rru_A1686 [Rhodospirillum rubrum ATCC 11170]AEO48204.1 hypothetical protein F11_08690 [Rhodospirillum rubrum F11]MBK1666369.1 hypothetical protein [Rhodospirillum rubrum]MBK1676402.1 hypothetical protein [Rhodospirillum rubrum]MBK5954070.1 hypothetical protein [Rhodospirillum rubrum]
MSTAEGQNRWRQKNKLVKRQLNVMARTFVHDTLERVAAENALRGKAEAVTYAAFIVMALEQHATLNPEARRLLDIYREAYHRDRDIYAP